MFAQQFDHSFNDLFNQYVNMDSGVDGNKDVSFPSSDLDRLFPLESFPSDCGDLSPSVSTSKRSRQSPQSWSNQEFWGLPQETGASSSTEQQGNLSLDDTIQPSAVSDVSITLDASSSSKPTATHSLLSNTLSTPPQTPRKKACTGSGVITPKSTRHHTTHERRALLRKQVSSPSLTRSSNVQKGKMTYNDSSAQRFQDFAFHNSDDHLPLSPPPSDILVQRQNLSDENTAQFNSSDRFTKNTADMPQQYDSNFFNQSPAISMPSPSANALARQQQRYLNSSHSSTLTSSPPSADEIFSSPHSSGSQSMPSWHSDSFGTSAVSFTPDLGSIDAQAWWSPMASRVAQRQPPYQPMLASPAPQRPISHPEQNDMLQGGLMINFDPSFGMSATAESSFASTMSSSAPTTNQETHYHQIANTPQNFINPSFATPQLHQNPHTSRSPSLSPRANGATATATSSSSPRTGPPAPITRTPMKTCHHRRSYDCKMSAPSNMPKPVKPPTTTATTATTGTSGSRNSSRSNGSSPKSSNKTVSVSFVNFTANDSKKILTGVAPSGSSKTKARREQEARDRRRKLSEAAMKAVRNAGGDIDSLEAVLC